MGYLNEDGLATLVGKVKGQVVQLTSAEYRNLPDTKLSDNKTYFVTDEDYAYAIDDEPTLNSDNLVKSGGVYTYTSKIGSGTLETTAQTIIPAINELKAGLTPISATYSTHGVTVYKVGRICVLSVNEPHGLSHDQNAWTTYAVLDSQFHPIGTVDTVVANNAAGDQTSTPLQLRIDTNGTVKVYNFTLSSLFAVGTVTYISKD